MGKIMIHNTQGKENLERASLAFATANIALTTGQETTVLLSIEGVRVATVGYADGLQADGFPPLGELISQFVNGSGRIWVCGASAKPRGISQTDLVEGARIVGAATAIEALVNGAQSLSF